MTKPIKCPDCGKKMVLRIASKGKFVGRPFYGCSNFPICKKIVNFKEEAEKKEKKTGKSNTKKTNKINNKTIKKSYNGNVYAKGYEFYKDLEAKEFIGDHNEELQSTTNNSLKELSKKLLDLTRRNRLINFRHTENSKRFVRFIDEIPDITLNKLNEGVTFDIISLPEPDFDPEDEKNENFLRHLDNQKSTDEDYIKKLNKISENDEDLSSKEAILLEREVRDKVRKNLGMPKRKDLNLMSVKEFAKSHNLDPDFNLPKSSNDENIDIHTDNKLQTLLTPDKYERVLLHISKVNKTQYDEKGVNFLYLIFGFLKWFENENSDKEIMSPILIMNCEISKKTVRNKTIFTIKSSGDPIQVNQTINERLQKDFGITLPDFDHENKNIEEYFEDITNLIQGKNAWEVKRFMTLSNLDYSKFLMFEDLNSSNWGKESGFLKHNIINEILYGQENEGEGSFAQTYEMDDINNFNSAPFLIFPADSSQHSAVIDALSQKNFSLKGPPGTGKSQTIANIIGSFLASNRTVLFLAEKKTAIDVVKKRLNQIGLGHFCLGITSPNKADVVDQLKDRLENSRNFRTDDFDDTKNRLLDNLTKLKEYKFTITKEYGRLGMRLYDILFKFLDLSKHMTENELNILKELNISNVNNSSLNEIEENKNKLNTAKNLSLELQKYFENKENPYKDIDKQLNPFEVDELISNSKLIPKTTEEISKNKLFVNLKLNLKIKITDIENLSNFIDKFISLKTLPEIVNYKVVSSNGAVKKIDELCNEIKFVIEYFNNFKIKDVLSLYQSLKNIPENFNDISDYIDNSKEEIKKTLKIINKLEKVINDFRKIISSDIDQLKISKLLKGIAPEKDLILKLSKFKNINNKVFLKSSTNIIKNALDELNQLSISQKEFRYGYDLSKASIRNLELQINNFNQSSSFTWFSGKYKEAKNYFDDICKDSSDKLSKEIMINELRKVLKYKKGEERFNDNIDYKEISLISVSSLISKIDQIQDILSLNEKLNLVAKNNRTSIDDISVDEILNFEKLVKFFEFYETESFKDLDQIISIFDNNNSSQIETVKEINEKALDDIDSNISNVKKIELKKEIKISNINEIYLKINSIKEQLEKIQTEFNLNILEIFDSNEISSIENSLSILNLISDSSFSSQTFENLMDIKSDSQKSSLMKLIEVLNSRISKFEDLTLMSIKEDNFESINEFCENFQNDINILPKWFEYKKILRKELTAEQQNIFKKIENNLDIENISKYYEFVFYYNLTKELYDEYPILSEFAGESLESIRGQYKQLDGQIFKLHSNDIHNTINRKSVPEGISVGRKKDLTEYGLIDYLANTERPRVQGLSLRNLVHKTFNALQALMPCFMMSPTYASQCLPRITGLFDLLIVDEASQLTPEMCISSMARSRQAIIVGDEKQLPPTSYFQRDDSDQVENEDDLEVIEEKSILDQSLARFKNIRDLRWHYRSRHQNLISFSNENFYLSRLNIFPNAEPGNEYYGIKYHYIETIYETRVNNDEVNKVCDLLEEFAIKYPEKSSIIVTMNQYQEFEIENEIARRRSKSKELNNYIDYWDLPENKIERFDVKNLENVQGDERDCVFISTIFGPQVKGKKPRQNFGPINKNGGHRRLNVLFTRAKDRIELVTSLKSSDILIEDAPLGRKIFAEYLLFAETGKLKVRETHGELEVDSPFQEFVKGEIKNLGYDVVNEVGVRGFSIDIGIKDPKNDSKFLCGVECDGATYHSSKSIRDNDKLRQEILESLGWNIYRIWSTDWFSDKNNQINKLKTYLENLTN